MPDPVENEVEQTPEIGEENVEQSSGPSLMGKLKAVGLVAAVVIVECGLAYMFIPGAEAGAQPSAAVAAAEAALVEEEVDEADEEEEVEVDIGEFRVTSYQPATNSTYRVNFHLYGAVAAEDRDDFITLKEANDARLREKVNVIVRAAEIPELTDPEMSLIKRRILDKINRILGKQIVKGVFLSDISFVEQ